MQVADALHSISTEVGPHVWSALEPYGLLVLVAVIGSLITGAIALGTILALAILAYRGDIQFTRLPAEAYPPPSEEPVED